MSILFTGTNQGRFTSDGSKKLLNIPSDLDWMYVYNLTELAKASGTGEGGQFYWQRGMATASAIMYVKKSGATELQVKQITDNGFTLIDTSDNAFRAAKTVTGISNAATPRVTTSGAHGYSTGDIVRIFNVNDAKQLQTIDFHITKEDNTKFDLTYMAQIAAASNQGTVRRIPFNPIYYPRNRYISKIVTGTTTVVTTTVPHGYEKGQLVRFTIPRVNNTKFGMTELDGVLATITDVDTANNTFTVDVNSTSFSAFAFPLTADAPFTPAQVVPVGMDTAEARDALVDDQSGATDNQAFRGIELGGGTLGPAGESGDVIYWVAGKSFTIDNN